MIRIGAVLFLGGCLASRAGSGLIPGPAERDEHIRLSLEHEADYDLIGRTSATNCGWSFVPIPPTIPASVSQHFPAVVSFSPSKRRAYEDAREQAGADFLADVEVSWQNQSYLFLVYVQCVTVEGFGAKLR